MKIEDDFTETVKYRNDLSRLKKSESRSEVMTLMDYIFRLEKQVQHIKEEVNDLQKKEG